MSASDPGIYFKLIEHDRDVLQLVSHNARPGCDTSDWQITILYYILCLYMKAFGRVCGRELQDHYSIKQWLNSESRLIPIARPYRKAEEWSRDARYEGRRFSSKEVERFLGWFKFVRQHVAGLLSTAGITNLPNIDSVEQ
ncbi:MAG: hypothetical protein ABSH28_08035 [Acidobacteriota bacterium]|jgi:hypothetical protein